MHFSLTTFYFIFIFSVAVGISVVTVILTGMGALFGFYVCAHFFIQYIKSSVVSKQSK